MPRTDSRQFETLTLPLRGREHLRLRDGLLAAFEQVSASGAPRLVDLVGPTGTGKTKIVQDLFRLLPRAGSYWPPEIGSTRKTIRPTTVGGEGAPEWIWLGLSCTYGPDGEHTPILRTQVPLQLGAHAAPILLRAARRAAGADLLRRSARALASLVGVELLRQVAEIAATLEELATIAADLRTLSTELRGPISVQDSVDESALEAFLELSRLIAAAGIPLVIAVEDVHWAEATLVELLRRVLERQLPVLLVTTSWPSITRSQERDAGQVGHELARLAATDRVERWRVPPLPAADLSAMALASLPGDGSDAARAGAAVIAERAQGNPLHLAFLVQKARMNDFRLGSTDIVRLRELRSSFDGALRDVWPYLPPAAQWTAMAATVIGTPTTRRVLEAATEALLPGALAPLRPGVSAAVAREWMIADPDPFGDDDLVRFSDPVYREAAAAAAREILPERQERACEAAIRGALRRGPRESLVASDLLVRNAARLLAVEGRCPSLLPAAMPLLFERSALRLWDQGRTGQAIGALTIAVDMAAAAGHRDALWLVFELAELMFQSGDVAKGNELLASLPGDPLIAYRADLLAREERWEEALNTAVEALSRAADDPADLLRLRRHFPSTAPVVLASEVASAAIVLTNRYDQAPRVAAAIADLLAGHGGTLPEDVSRGVYAEMLQIGDLDPSQRTRVAAAVPFDPGDVEAERVPVSVTDEEDRSPAPVGAAWPDADPHADVRRHAAGLARARRSLPEDHPRTVRQRMLLVVALARAGRCQQAETELMLLARIAEDTGFKSARLHHAYARGWHCLATNADADAAASLEAVRDDADALHLPLFELDLALCLAWARVGRWRDVRRLAETWPFWIVEGRTPLSHSGCALWLWASRAVVAPRRTARELADSLFPRSARAVRPLARDAAALVLAELPAAMALVYADPLPIFDEVGMRARLADALARAGRAADAERLRGSAPD